MDLMERSGAEIAPIPGDDAPDLTIVVVSYNTKDLTLAALRSVFDQTLATRFEIIVVDNASHDGSADAVASEFPSVCLIRSPENLGFARANNLAAERARGKWLLLLNPDTVVLDSAVDRLVAFGEAHPEGGIYGGRTIFPDGSLNIASCWNRITPWSAFCQATGLSTLFKRSKLFDPEALGPFRRDAVRRVDIVVGCFLLISRALWNRLGGFDTSYWMYGEEADLCLRAKELGYRPVITPDATIVHLVGAASAAPAKKTILVAKARATLIRRHWRGSAVPWGLSMLRMWSAGRFAATAALARLFPARFGGAAEKWRTVWAARADWLAGYPPGPAAAPACVHKKSLSKPRRFLRLLAGSLDVRAYIHLIRMANYYNYTHVQPRRKIAMGRRVSISPDVAFSHPERIRIGDGVRLGSRCHLWAGPSRGRISIGENALFGPDVLVTAATYRYNDGSPVSDQLMDEADVTIGRDVWLGAKVVILPGVSIGDGAVIGAASVVTKNVPAGAVAAGVPARVVGRRQPVFPGAFFGCDENGEAGAA